MIPVMKVELRFDSHLLPYLLEIEAAGVYGNFGPQVVAMETEFAQLVGVPATRLVSVANATLGLQGAMAMLDCSTWVIPSWTFAATAHAAMMQRNAKIWFGDVEEHTWALDPSHVLEGEGAVVTAPFGAQVSIGSEWNHVSCLVIDAAAAIGAFPVILPEFDQPWAIVVSLHATKVLGIGEGGLVVFSSEHLAQRFRQWTNFGFFGSREAEFLGTNAKLPEVTAAIARFRLKKWETEREDWEALRQRVHQVGENLGINPPFSLPTWVSPYWIGVFSDSGMKDKVLESLSSFDVESRNWWGKGCHSMTAFQSLPRRSELRVTDRLAATSLGLPFFLGLTDREIHVISNHLGPNVKVRGRGR